jgi:hypothetical protein
VINSPQRLTTHNTHKGQDIHDPGGIRTRNPSKRAPQTHSLDGTATGTGAGGKVDYSHKAQLNFETEITAAKRISACYRITVRTGTPDNNTISDIFWPRLLASKTTLHSIFSGNLKCMRKLNAKFKFRCNLSACESRSLCFVLHSTNSEVYLQQRVACSHIILHRVKFTTAQTARILDCATV